MKNEKYFILRAIKTSHFVIENTLNFKEKKELEKRISFLKEREKEKKKKRKKEKEKEKKKKRKRKRKKEKKKKKKKKKIPRYWIVRTPT